MEAWICSTCGTQFAPNSEPPPQCPICHDQRQYVGHNGQTWTTLGQLFAQGRRNSFRGHEPGLIGIGTVPGFAIGQRALLLRSPGGNVLWDCISYLDETTVEIVQALGGLRAIAISHPHYYSSMVEWAARFDAEIILHEDDREWVQRPDPRIRFWNGERFSLHDGLALLRLGGHFRGAQVLHWPAGADGRGALLTGDTVTVVADRRFVSFMYSYPNLIPLPKARIEAMRAQLQPLAFDRLYGAWFDRVIDRDAKAAVLASAARYIAVLEGEGTV